MHYPKANLTKNVQGNDIDILSVKKYMLDSYRKIDNYFEEAVRSKHANDSAAEIRKRSELNYLDTSMRELVAEVSEAHGADFSQVYILVRLYEVNDDEDIVKDITYATNSQNPIDFRDLKSNDSIQILLETSAADLVNIFLHI